ncbi:hypothetical protein PsorP6_009501 [Peronosclerospora sorghi]|uniref:Uncharacterized protein n=1 Tax=Peronosclerospora sorghi TaxID=230839 RepID=A0ACC0W154_9STRA|nr:hypothetical protein PsorP6_009501 [Peronosclerospora sorghi]
MGEPSSSAATNATPQATETTSHKLSVYSRLSDPKSYTGVYKKRFETDYHDETERVVHDLSDTMRPNLNHFVGRPKRPGIPRHVVNSTPSTTTSDSVPSSGSAPSERPLSTPPVQEKNQGDPNDPHTLLKAIFQYYCRFGRTGPKGVEEKTLDNSNFVKLCRDCPDLIGTSLSNTDVDLIFVKSKKKGERRINYARFLDALGMLAIQKYDDMPLEASMPKLLETHFAHLPCLLEYADGKTVQAVWQKRSEHTKLSETSVSPDAVVATEQLAAFFHSFYRFGWDSNDFDLRSGAYVNFLNSIVLAFLCIGALVFLVLCVIVVRRTVLHIRSGFSTASVRRTSINDTTVELLAVGLLTFLAISALGGLLGEAQVDYSAGVVLDTMTNTSNLFQHARDLTKKNLDTSDAVRYTADNLITSFNESELPADAFKLSIEALRLVHTSKGLWNQTDALLPKNYSELAKDWEFSYFVVKSSTNGAILAVTLASFLSIASVGWSMVSPLRVSILVILSVVPISHTLIGAYLSSTIMTADFCAAPMNHTLELVGTTPVANYYVQCPANASLPFADAVASVQQTAAEVGALQHALEQNASHEGEMGRRMKRDFLDPIGKQLENIDERLSQFTATQTCKNVSSALEYAATTFCEYGMLGFFSMWVHQILLCLILFVCVVASVLVYERVHIREVRQDVRYHVVSSHEDDAMEHVYRSSA